MKKNFNTIFYVILFFLLLINKSHSNTLKPECYQLFDKIKKDWKSKELYNSQMLHYVDFGFELATDEKNNFEVKKTKTGNYVIGAITSQNIYGDIRSGDELLYKTSQLKTDFYECVDNYKYVSRRDEYVLQRDNISRDATNICRAATNICVAPRNKLVTIKSVNLRVNADVP